MNESDNAKWIQFIQTPQGPLSVIRPVAEKLLTNGIVSGTMDNLHAADAAAVKAGILLNAHCDFCSEQGAQKGFYVPDFDMPMGAGESTGGWAACETCAGLITDNNKKGLLDRCVDTLAFPKFSRKAIEELHAKFWVGITQLHAAMATADVLTKYIDNVLPDYPALPDALEGRLAVTARITNLSPRELREMRSTPVDKLPEPILNKLYAFRKKFGQIDPASIADLLAPRPPTPPSLVPHWQQAVDAQFECARFLTMALKKTEFAEHFPSGTKGGVEDIIQMAVARKKLTTLGFELDAHMLPQAQAYSFSAETEAAILEASQSIPHDMPLSSIETPVTGSGWFWFSQPLPIVASPLASDHTIALLWGWLEDASSGTVTVDTDETTGFLPWEKKKDFKGPALMFSAYVRDDRGTVHRGRILPSTRWFWPFSMTFDEMLADNMEHWAQMYGDGGPLANDPQIMPLEGTMKVIADLSLFFAMACVWFRQTVPGNPKKKADPTLVQSPGHIERHARKRLVKDFKLQTPPTVHVVALRKTARAPIEEAPADRQASAREYHCKWIVKGHPRKQRCGPGGKDVKLIWIDAYPKGPEDKPLKTKQTSVFAVVR